MRNKIHLAFLNISKKMRFAEKQESVCVIQALVCPLNLILILCLFQNGPFPFQSKSYPIESGIIGKQYCRNCGERCELNVLK